jgi:uncharacterized membrane protein YkoI
VLSGECRDHGFSYSNNAGHGLHPGQELSKQAKVSITEARAIALKAHPGKITDEELEKEKRGTGLRYSFDIQRGAVTQEVGVDAQTGKVLENKKEGPHPD